MTSDPEREELAPEEGVALKALAPFHDACQRRPAPRSDVEHAPAGKPV